MLLCLKRVPWYTDFASSMVSNLIPEDIFFHQKRKFLHDVKRYFLDEPYLFSRYTDNIIRRCIPEINMLNILQACHASLVGGQNAGDHTVRKVLQSGYYWETLFKDS